jgi:transposase
LTILPGVATDRLEELEIENARLRLQNQALVDELEAVKRRFFGRSSEKASEPPQPQLFDEAEIPQSQGEPPEVTVSSHTRGGGGRKALPADLEREEVLIDIPEEEKHCACGNDLKRIGEEVSEKLEVIPARFTVKRYVRPKYACHHCEGSADEDLPAVRIARMPPAIIERGIATPTLLAFIIVNKYVDSMPLARQEASFARLGVELPRQRMADWIMAVGEAAAPVVEQLLVDLRAGPVLLADETTVQVLGEENRSDTSKSYMWVGYGGVPEAPVVCYRYAAGRSTSEAENLIGSFSGYLQTDGYEAYDRLCRERADLIHVGCWAHARRKFFDAKGGSKKAGAAEQAIAMIAKLYQVERELADLDDEYEFVSRRRIRVEPILESMKSWLEKKALHVPPQTALGKAVGYTLGQWEKLVRYLEHRDLTPDTNRVENKIRPFVIGRKNWLFSGSPRGANATAGIYSLIETAKANGIDPYRYMRTLITHLPVATTTADFRSLLPYTITLD